MSEAKLADVEGMDVEAIDALRLEVVCDGVLDTVDTTPEAADEEEDPVGVVVVGDEPVNTAWDPLPVASVGIVNREKVEPFESTSICCTTEMVAVTCVTVDVSTVAVASEVCRFKWMC